MKQLWWTLKKEYYYSFLSSRFTSGVFSGMRYVFMTLGSADAVLTSNPEILSRIINRDAYVSVIEAF